MSDYVRLLEKPRHAQQENRTVIWKTGDIRNLNKVHQGHRIKIMAIRLEPFKRRELYALGLHEASEALVIHNDHRGRLMLKMDKEVFLLGRRETPRISVREYIPTKT